MMPLRTYIDTARARIGRVATTAGSAALTAGLFTDAVTLPGLTAALGAALLGVGFSPRLIAAPEKVKPIAMMVYASPHAGMAGILVAERVASGGVARLVEAGAVTAWTAGVWWIRPASLAKRIAKPWPADEATEQPQETSPAVQEVADPAARWWAENVAREGGIAPGTRLVATQRIDADRKAAVIAATTPGVPVPEISITRLSALTDIPEDKISIDPIPGRGAGLRMLTIGKKRGASADTWTEIARSALPGVELVETNTYELKELR
ncbi:hypothetical protein ADL28_08830 [Streptomyces violaceusniger]|uniref:MFS transporter n=2 Tax=Streptomyces violaceusniger group TaxID=2839105 RepID=A0ABD5JI30_9ACTN|nr:hypothetical protein [Streptomyces violaceusniger]KUL64779.1 hypothetical protein ADL28_08830 [Streptomyces violaceusniger]MEE4588075.1 hypothetical protein [Streptomyces sp. DSM 41602]